MGNKLVLGGVWWILEMLAIFVQSILVEGNILTYISFWGVEREYAPLSAERYMK